MRVSRTVLREARGATPRAYSPCPGDRNSTRQGFAFMKANQATWPLATMARLLKVSRSGFHAWCHHVPSAHAQQDATLLTRIRAIYLRSHGGVTSHHHGGRLRIFVERSDQKTEAQFKGYFDDMRRVGAPFNTTTSQKYAPLAAETLHATLLEFRTKTKSSALMQFADLVLWPVCQGGYDANHRAYTALVQAGKLIDVLCTEDNGLQGIKYSCFG